MLALMKIQFDALVFQKLHKLLAAPDVQIISLRTRQRSITLLPQIAGAVGN
jgi:hypothetical protein